MRAQVLGNVRDAPTVPTTDAVEVVDADEFVIPALGNTCVACPSSVRWRSRAVVTLLPRCALSVQMVAFRQHKGNISFPHAFRFFFTMLARWPQIVMEMGAADAGDVREARIVKSPMAPVTRGPYVIATAGVVAVVGGR